MNENQDAIILKINGLRTYFSTEEGIAHAVDDVSLSLRKGEVLGLVGESGCGKSVTALSILRLIPKPPGEIVAGEIIFGKYGDLTRITEAEMRKIRGNEISMIFQEPMTSLNPVFRIKYQLVETIRLHQHLLKNEALNRAIEMLELVGIPSPEKRINEYPHQMSGGMRQRTMIAMALSCNPKLMIADEPTTALDVTIQAQILDLIKKLKEEVGTSIILITHDLGIIAEMAQTVSVMYAGVVVESANVRTLFGEPLHPYTKGLLTSIPRGGRTVGKKARLNTIPGVVPSLYNLPRGCRFHDRCSYAHAPCQKWEPSLVPPYENPDQEHRVRCWLHQKNVPE